METTAKHLDIPKNVILVRDTCRAYGNFDLIHHIRWLDLNKACVTLMERGFKPGGIFLSKTQMALCYHSLERIVGSFWKSRVFSGSEFPEDLVLVTASEKDLCLHGKINPAAIYCLQVKGGNYDSND